MNVTLYGGYEIRNRPLHVLHVRYWNEAEEPPFVNPVYHFTIQN